MKNTTYADWLKTERTLDIRGKVGNRSLNRFEFEFDASDVVTYSIHSSLSGSGVSVGNVTSATYSLELSKDWEHCDEYLQVSRQMDLGANVAKFVISVEIGIETPNGWKYEPFGRWLVDGVSGDDSLSTTIQITGMDALDSLSEMLIRDTSSYGNGQTSVPALLKRICEHLPYVSGCNVPAYDLVNYWNMQYVTWGNDPTVPGNKLLYEYRPMWGGIKDGKPYWVSNPSSMLASTASLRLANVRTAMDGYVEVVQPELKYPQAIGTDYIIDMDIDRTRWFDIDTVVFQYNPVDPVSVNDDGEAEYNQGSDMRYVKLCRNGSPKQYKGSAILIEADTLNPFAWILERGYIGGIGNGIAGSGMNGYPDFARRVRNIVSGTVNYIGVPDLLAGDLVLVKGVSDSNETVEHRLFLTDVSYTFDGGLSCTLTCNLENPYDPIYLENEETFIQNMDEEREFDSPVKEDIPDIEDFDPDDIF